MKNFIEVTIGTEKIAININQIILIRPLTDKNLTKKY